MIDRKILLVEDNPRDAELTMRALKKGDLTNDIVLVSDGEEAVHYLFGEGKYADRDVSDIPAVVLLDLNLPKLNGHEVLARIRSNETTKLMPVVILTSSSEESDVEKGYENGCNAYVQKPVEFEQFSDAVAQLGMFWLLLNEPLPREPGE
jgi:two-component system response regulator